MTEENQQKKKEYQMLNLAKPPEKIQLIDKRYNLEH